MAPSLMEDLVEEILLRLPPNDAVHLFRAALVCKDWCRVISGSGFRRRFHKVHRMAAPILGLLYSTRFMPTISSSFRLPYDEFPFFAIHTLQSRILFYDTDYDPFRLYLVVLNPIRGMVRWLPKRQLPLYELSWSWSAALICATAGCDHLNCDYGPFLVVLVCIDGGFAHASVYSSETREWSEQSKPISVLHHHALDPIRGPGAHVGNAAFFEVKYVKKKRGILKYDVGKQELSLLSLPSTCEAFSCKLMGTDDGKLAFTTVQGSKLCVWSMEALLDGGSSWAQRTVIDLNKLIIPDYHFSDENLDLPVPTEVLSVTGGHNVVFIRMGTAIFTVDLMSGGMSKLLDGCDPYMSEIVPYQSFCTPALGAAPANEEPRSVI